MTVRRGPSRPPWATSTGAFVAAHCLALASAAEAALRSMGAAGDAEALHDFRVALRRLRSCLRAHRDQVRLPRALKRRLRALMRSTGAARDQEALAERLGAWRTGLKPAERAAARLLIARWTPGSAERSELVSGLRRDWRALRLRVRTALAAAAPTARRRYGPVLADLVEEGVRDLASADAAARTPAELHAVRIAAKRLRYLLEPLATGHPAVLDALTMLRGVQDLLGEINDCLAIAGRLEQGAAEAAVREVRAAVGAATRADEMKLIAACACLAPVVARRRDAALRRRTTACTRPIAALPATLAPFLAALRAPDHTGVST
jgi:CHAD domain-containing protein